MTEQELRHIPEELRELFALLDAQGLRPQLCDTPVTYYDNAAHCGSPMGAGDIVEGEYQWLPRDIVHRDLEGKETAKQRGPVGLLPLLPQEFTLDDVRALRIAQGMKPDPKEVLRQWVCRGLVVKDDERGVYLKRA